MSFRPNKRRLREVYERMFEAYGPQHWWPGETPFEVMVGAVLTQNTAWTNVARAIANLKAADALELAKILALPQERLAELIRPAGYFNVKAARLRSFCEFLDANGGIASLAALPDRELRERVLAVKGVGPETADDIVLYAFHRPVFVIDAYTRRLVERLGLADGGEPYDELRLGFEKALGADVPLFNEYHGLIVRHHKVACSKRNPRCDECCVRPLCKRRGIA